jgi:hypothetical protein
MMIVLLLDFIEILMLIIYLNKYQMIFKEISIIIRQYRQHNLIHFLKIKDKIISILIHIKIKTKIKAMGWLIK